MRKKNMSEEAREESRRYQREWRAANKEKVRSYNAKYWESKAKKQKEESECPKN